MTRAPTIRQALAATTQFARDGCEGPAQEGGDFLADPNKVEKFCSHLNNSDLLLGNIVGKDPSPVRVSASKLKGFVRASHSSGG